MKWETWSDYIITVYNMKIFPYGKNEIEMITVFVSVIYRAILNFVALRHFNSFALLSRSSIPLSSEHYVRFLVELLAALFVPFPIDPLHASRKNDVNRKAVD